MCIAGYLIKFSFKYCEENYYVQHTLKKRRRGRVGKGVGHLAHVWSYGVREVVMMITLSEFEPRPGQYSRMSFSSGQVTGTVFPHLNMPFLPNSEFI